jgi:hypothetical protein
VPKLKAVAGIFNEIHATFSTENKFTSSSLDARFCFIEHEDWKLAWASQPSFIAFRMRHLV